MFLIQQITSAPAQKQSLILPDGSSFSMTLAFYPQQYGWFIQNLVYKNFTINGLRITTSPNMLNQWVNSLTFGLACTCVGNREPTQQQDFSSGAALLYVLSAAEVAQYSRILKGATS